MKKIYILGSASKFGMERSYKSALEKLGFEVEIIDFSNMVNAFIPVKFLQRLGLYIDISPAIVKTNHSVAKKAFLEKPYAIIVFTHVKLYPGTIEYFKTFCKNVSFYWPDSIVNMSNNIFSNLKHYTKVYAHSKENVDIFAKNGVKAQWLPFAGDTLLSESFDAYSKKSAEYDFSFIGAYRPERYDAINELLKNFPQSKFLLVGLGWKKLSFHNRNNLTILDKMVDINEFLDYTSKSKIALNAIDHLNYPSSNLRFFEIALSGIPQIATFVPEFEEQFQEAKHVYYFKNLNELVEKAKAILSNYDEALKCGLEFRKSVDSDHNYISRAQSLVNDFI
ncbi:glycosyltransferase family protein [Chryseobacterium caseinilyticum]|uniref:Glycosyltransferase family 1 protein n=1 Tax=Chryseobacterium caseinilyticum TaxID=2771428 RepID=A0ABR8ZAR3_9FLAO|nr:glycosyltransferase [Chryseobacterium caseinilyticum]MBD8082321.1 glycosyltransferase family 1 protein [Chryseobacterium caseinilyticum]